MIVLDPAASLEVVQVAKPLEDTVMLGQSATELLLTVKLTVPEGDTAKGPPASCAVKVTAVLTLVELEGEALTPMVVASAETVCGSVLEVLPM